jgi:hypothetical protein
MGNSTCTTSTGSESPGESIVLHGDSLISLPKACGLVVNDRLSKMVHLIPTDSNMLQLLELLCQPGPP